MTLVGSGTCLLMNGEDDMEGIEEITIHDFVAPDLTKQTEQIATELFEVAKMIGYQPAPDEEAVMGHYQCSFLAANAGIALCMKLCDAIELPKQSFLDWILRRAPKTSD